MNTLSNTNSIINEIKMMKNKKFYIIVEGVFDAKFYKRYFNTDLTSVKQCNGKEKAIEVYKKLKEDNSLDKLDILFILDQDYDIFFNTQIVHDKVFYTDTHDLDIMLINSNCFQKFIDLICAEERVNEFTRQNDCTNLKEYIFNIAKLLGILRIVSIRDSYNFSFKTLDYNKFIDRNTLSIDVDKLIVEVKNKSQMPQIDNDEIKEKLNQEFDIKLDVLVNGHDVLNILSESMKKAFANNSNNKYSHDDIQNNFLLGYEYTDFLTTNLFKSIEEYCKNRSLSICNN